MFNPLLFNNLVKNDSLTIPCVYIIKTDATPNKRM